MSFQRRLVLALAICCGGWGCAWDQVESLESRLRRQEDENRALRSRLDVARSELQAVRRENNALHAQISGPGRRALLPEQAAAVFTLHELTLNRKLTGGIDTDGRPGHDALLVTVEPRDARGDVLKAPGSIAVELFEPGADGSENRIGSWTFELSESLRQWVTGLFASGYQFKLPWQRGYPRASELLVKVRFTTPDARTLTASRSIRVKLPDNPVPNAASSRASREVSRASAVAHHVRTKQPSERLP